MLWAERSGAPILAGARDFYHLQDVEAGSGAHSTPLSMKAMNRQRRTSAHPLYFYGVTRNTLNPPPPTLYDLLVHVLCAQLETVK